MIFCNSSISRFVIPLQVAFCLQELASPWGNGHTSGLEPLRESEGEPGRRGCGKGRGRKKRRSRREQGVTEEGAEGGRICLNSFLSQRKTNSLGGKCRDT